MRATEVTVHWNPLSDQYANGRLLGYRVYLLFPVSPRQYNKSSVNVTNPNITWVTLTGLKPRTFYYVGVAAFTSKGVGAFPTLFDSYSNVTTG